MGYLYVEGGDRVLICDGSSAYLGRHPVLSDGNCLIAKDGSKGAIKGPESQVQNSPSSIRSGCSQSFSSLKHAFGASQRLALQS